LGLRGKHQIVNTAVAIRLAESLRRRGFEIPGTSIISGIETVRHPGRLELRSGHPSVLFDGAHNPSGAQALREYLDEFVKGPLTIVFGAMNDKRLKEIATILFPSADQLILTRPDNARAAGIGTLRDLAMSTVATQKIISTQSVTEALQRALEVTPPDGLICVTGSLYLIGEIKAIMGAAPLPEVGARV
jgi:dihydrofolate synthase/folylpolyglutamate synthase